MQHFVATSLITPICNLYSTHMPTFFVRLYILLSTQCWLCFAPTDVSDSIADLQTSMEVNKPV